MTITTIINKTTPKKGSIFKTKDNTYIEILQYHDDSKTLKSFIEYKIVDGERINISQEDYYRNSNRKLLRIFREDGKRIYEEFCYGIDGTLANRVGFRGDGETVRSCRIYREDRSIDMSIRYNPDMTVKAVYYYSDKIKRYAPEEKDRSIDKSIRYNPDRSIKAVYYYDEKIKRYAPDEKERDPWI